jgi:hypothetical protein
MRHLPVPETDLRLAAGTSRSLLALHSGRSTVFSVLSRSFVNHRFFIARTGIDDYKY